MPKPSETREENAPQEIEHCCARCLSPVSADARECAHCSRRFVGRGRFERLEGPPPSVESVSMLRLHEG